MIWLGLFLYRNGQKTNILIQEHVLLSTINTEGQNIPQKLSNWVPSIPLMQPEIISEYYP